MSSGIGRGRWAIVAFFGPPLALLGLVFAMRVWAGISVSTFTRDPAATLGGPFYVGLVSHCGVLLWCAAAACCFFGYAVVRRRGSRDADAARFLLASGMLTTLLLLDDLFQLHEDVYRVYLHVPEPVAVGAYGAIVLAYLYRFRATIRRSEYGWLLTAFVLFGISVTIDEMIRLAHLRYLVEDGSKFLGIASWLAYLSRTSLAHVVGVGSAASPRAAMAPAATRRASRDPGDRAGVTEGREGGRNGRRNGLSALDLTVSAAFVTAPGHRLFTDHAAAAPVVEDPADRFELSAALSETRMT